MILVNLLVVISYGVASLLGLELDEEFVISMTTLDRNNYFDHSYRLETAQSVLI